MIRRLCRKCKEERGLEVTRTALHTMTSFGTDEDAHYDGVSPPLHTKGSKAEDIGCECTRDTSTTVDMKESGVGYDVREVMRQSAYVSVPQKRRESIVLNNNGNDSGDWGGNST